MNHYVAYHSVRKMGYDLDTTGDRQRFLSQKPQSTLERALGNPTWMVVGHDEGARTRFELAGVFWPDDVDSAEQEGVLELSGPAVHFARRLDAASLSWFPDLKREQANFSLGFHKVSSANVKAALDLVLNEIRRKPSSGMSFSRDERRTYLLGWNALEEWPTRDQSAQKLRHRTLVPIRWTCGRTKGILPGDRVFVVHQGTNSAGIVASGWVSRGTFNTGERTDPSSRITPLVIEFSPDVLLSSAEPALDVQGLDDAAVRAVNWSRVSSGVGISKASAEALETLWSAHEHALHLTRDRGSPQGTLRVLNSGADEDWHTLRASARDGEQASWFAPKGTEIGDDVLFFIQGRGIVAKGRACSTATYKGDDPRASAEIGDIELVEPALTPADLQQALPDWKWLTYPRSYTSPNPDIATRLWELCSDRNPDAAPAHEGAEEGEFVTVLHRRRERDRGIVAAKKAEALRATGSLHCEVCQFDFEQVYGERGEDCCEVHHLDPLGARDGSRRTKLEDLAILCANCHRMVHRAPLLTPAELRSELARRHRVRVDGAAEEAAS